MSDQGDPGPDTGATPPVSTGEEQLVGEVVSLDSAIEESVAPAAKVDQALLAEATVAAEQAAADPVEAIEDSHDEPATELLVCPNCGEENAPGMAWCEACGADLSAAPSEALPATPCIACDAPPSAISADGWCEQCGQRQPNKRDHNVTDLGSTFGATDKGLRHHRNEDAMAMATTAVGAILVVCDGVSSTERPDEASQAAADAALEILVAAGADSSAAATPPSVSQAMVDAAGRAQDAVVEISEQSEGGEPPSCTFVAATIEATDAGFAVVVGWLGDSRAYWISEAGSEVLTTDHSWAEHQRSLGELSEDEIVKDRRSHSITRWIGVDVDDPIPEVLERTFTEPGLLLLCSDGLWNYADTPEALASRVNEAQAASANGAEVAEHLVAFANASGGRDNITVCIADTAALPATAAATRENEPSSPLSESESP